MSAVTREARERAVTREARAQERAKAEWEGTP